MVLVSYSTQKFTVSLYYMYIYIYIYIYILKSYDPQFLCVSQPVNVENNACFLQLQTAESRRHKMQQYGSLETQRVTEKIFPCREEQGLRNHDICPAEWKKVSKRVRESTC